MAIVIRNYKLDPLLNTPNIGGHVILSSNSSAVTDYEDFNPTEQHTTSIDEWKNNRTGCPDKNIPKIEHDLGIRTTDLVLLRTLESVAQPVVEDITKHKTAKLTVSVVDYVRGVAVVSDPPLNLTFE
jgi:hypothetical protein